MPAQTDPDLTLLRAARACQDACLAAGSLSRLTLPVEHRELARSAARHLDVAQEALFKIAHLPRPKPPRQSQLSMEVLNAGNS